MKRIFTFLLLVSVAQAFAQTNPVTSITISLPANPDANTANWGTGTSQFIITATTQPVNGRIDGHVQESKILVQIKKGGSKVCGSYTSSTAPASGFNAINKVWGGANAVSLLGKSCILPPGDYELSVQFFSYGAVTRALSDEKTKAFTIRGNEQQVYQAPQNAAPANGTTYKEADVPKPITFRWTPLIPRPQEPVTYRLRVWQLMQGQNGTQAMKTNQPVITKDVDNLTQTIVTGIISGPCKPPYLCDFVWNVQALNRDGKPIGGNGTSDVFTFKFDIPAKEESAVYLGLRMPANGSTIKTGESPQFTWLLPITTPGGPFTYKIKIVEVTGNEASAQGIRTNKPIFERDSSLELHTNKPHFEKDSIRDKFIQYPPSAPALKAGSTYSWAVQALNRDGKPIGLNNGTSEVFTFKVDGKPTDVVTSPSLKLSSPANGAVIPAGETTRFTWLPPMPDIPTGSSYKIKIVEIKGDQSPEQAIRTNKPIFERDTVMGLSVQHPSLAFKPGQKYAWNVLAKGRDGKPIGGNNGTSETWTFSISGKATETSLRLSFPANGAELSEGDRPEFTWLPPTPTVPRESSYKIKIVEIKGDQSPEQALRTNKPIFERDTVMGLSIKYPDTAPAFKKDERYAWNVQAGGRQGKVISSDNFVFKSMSGGCVGKLTFNRVTCGGFVNGSYKYNVCLTYTADATNMCNIAYNDPQNAALNSMLGHNLSNIIYVANGGSISNITFSPAAPVLAPGQSVQVCFDLLSTQSIADIYTYGLCKDGKELIAPNFANDNIGVELKPCNCTFCDDLKEWAIKDEVITASSSAPFTVNLSAVITAPGIPIKSFKAELISFVQSNKYDECLTCNKDYQTFGNFTAGTFGSWGNGVFPLYGSSTTHHTLTWFSPSGGTIDLAGQAINVAFTAPPFSAMECCNDEIQFCIRYSFTDAECRTCSYVKCYTVKRKR